MFAGPHKGKIHPPVALLRLDLQEISTYGANHVVNDVRDVGTFPQIASFLKHF